MRRYCLIVILLLGCVSVHAQMFNMLNNDIYMGRVKLVSEFMKRFNLDEKHPFIDSNSAEQDKKNLCQLFDIDSVLKNRQINEPRAFQFVDSVLQNNVKIHYIDAEWFAKVKCIGTFKGKEVSFDMLLTVERRGKDMFKWVISDVEGDIFNLSPSRKSDKIMLLPNEHESNFMRLNSITSEKDDYITLYSSDCISPSRLTVFNTLVYYGYLNIEYITDIRYTFLQVPGFIFTIKECERESTNSGWLISDWSEISNTDKEALLQRIYNGKYSARVSEEVENTLPNNSPQIDATLAISKIEQFVKYLNDYIANKSSVDEIRNSIKGRYTFIISDELSKQLSKYYKTKAQNSYRIETLLGWLGKANSPIKSIQILNPELFLDENIRPEYSNGYTLIKCELSTTGDLQITEQVVFFIYENQIAGVKFISDCF